VKRRAGAFGRWAVLALPWAWLALFFVAPFVLVAKISLAEMQLGIPPYTPLIDGEGRLRLSLADYRLLFSDALYVKAYVGSLRVAALATLGTLVLGFPLALAVARAPARWRTTLLLLIAAPFWTSFLVRIYAWIGLLRPTGLVNATLIGLGLIDAPLKLINTEAAAVFGIVYAYLPFMVLPLYARLEKLDPALLDAAADLGASPWRAFRAVTLPWAWPGIAAGALLVFVPALGEFVIPELLGGPDTLMIGKVMWNEFFANRDWPLSAAAAVLLLIVLTAPVMAFQAFAARTEPGP
jgi:putrescine transport system permease protein